MQTERQKEIIETALSLINEKGIQGLTIKNLSKNLGITEPAIYRHFENKIHILTEILDIMKRNTNGIFESGLHSSDSALTKIEVLFKKNFNSFTQMPSMASVVFSEEIFKNEKKLINKISELVDQNNKILITIITEGQNRMEIRGDISAEHLAILIMGTLRLFIKKWQFSDFGFNLQSEGEKLIESVKQLIKHQ